MNILVLEEPYADPEELEELYNAFTEGNVSVATPDQYDNPEQQQWDAVFTELFPYAETTGPEMVNDIEADYKAVYTAWDRERIEATGQIDSTDLDNIDYLLKPQSLDLEEMLN